MHSHPLRARQQTLHLATNHQFHPMGRSFPCNGCRIPRWAILWAYVAASARPAASPSHPRGTDCYMYGHNNMQLVVVVGCFDDVLVRYWRRYVLCNCCWMLFVTAAPPHHEVARVSRVMHNVITNNSSRPVPAGQPFIRNVSFRCITCGRYDWREREEGLARPHERTCVYSHR